MFSLLTLTLVTLQKVCLSGFSTVRWSPHPSILYSLEGSHHQSPQCFFSLRVKYVHQLFIILLWEICLLSPFTLSFTYITVALWILICTLGYNPTLLYVFCCTDCSGFGHWEAFSWLPCPFDMSLLMWFLFIVFEHFLMFCHYQLLQV